MFQFIKNLFTPKVVVYHVACNDIANVIGSFTVKAKDAINIATIIKQEMRTRTGRPIVQVTYHIDGWGRDLYKVKVEASQHTYIISNSIRG